MAEFYELRTTNYEPNAQVLHTKNPKIWNFLTALPKTSYEYRESGIKDFFRPNAQVRPIMGTMFRRKASPSGFKTPKKNTLKKYANKSLWEKARSPFD